MALKIEWIYVYKDGHTTTGIDSPDTSIGNWSNEREWVKAVDEAFSSWSSAILKEADFYYRLLEE